MILGIDASTKCVGYCLLNEGGSLGDLGYIWLEKIKNEYDKIDVVEEVFSRLSPSVIYVESPLQRSNNQNVVNLLNVWSGMIRLCAYKTFGIKPILIPESTARKINEIKVPRGVIKEEKKKYVLQCLLDFGVFPKDKLEYKRTGNYKSYVYDQADAMVVAWAGYKLEKMGVSK